METEKDRDAFAAVRWWTGLHLEGARGSGEAITDQV